MADSRALASPREIAVIVSTYDRPDPLEAVLASLEDQTYQRFTVVVADDGSASETREMVEGVVARDPFPVRHVWQEDRGYRLAAIRNRAVAAVESDYLVFIDGDCLVRPDFLSGHERLAAAGRLVHGSRIRLGPEVTDAALRDRVAVHSWSTLRWLGQWGRGRVDRAAPLFRLPLGPLREITPRRWEGVKGCNLAMWRDDYLDINGFDESYEGWGLEDNDLVVRLIRSGVVRKEGRYAVPVLHLWHGERPLEEPNRRRFDDMLRSDAVRAERGVDQYL